MTEGKPKPTPREVLTPSAFATLQLIVDSSSFAAAARAMNMVPSGLSYRVRQLEEALAVQLFERGQPQARLTEAGAELLREGAHLLSDIDAIATRVRQLAAGWESQFTIAVDSLIDRVTVMELCENFYGLKPPTRLKLRTDTLSGTLEAVTSGNADLAVGVLSEVLPQTDVNWRPLGSTRFVFAVAPDHPLADAPEPLTDEAILRHRAVVLADSTRKGPGYTRGLLTGQDEMTVTDLAKKIEAQASGLGVGFLPLCRAQRHIDAGELVVRRVVRPGQQVQVGYAWKSGGKAQQGRALRWWLGQLQTPATQSALLGERRRAD